MDPVVSSTLSKAENVFVTVWEDDGASEKISSEKTGWGCSLVGECWEKKCVPPKPFPFVDEGWEKKSVVPKPFPFVDGGWEKKSVVPKPFPFVDDGWEKKSEPPKPFPLVVAAAWVETRGGGDETSFF